MFAQLTCFDGPRTDEQVAAAAFAGRERIAPAVATIPGIVGGYVLRGPDNAEIVLTLAETEDALRDAQRAVMSTELLPRENPALLTGPDRVEIFCIADQFGAMSKEAGR
jgi:hypothetical protein